MDGTLLNFDPAGGTGLIRASDGKRYSFSGGQWKSASAPRVGDLVDFEVEEGQATEIYPVRSDGPAAAPDPHASILQTAMETSPSPAEVASAFRGNVPALVCAALIPLSFFLPWFSASGWSVSFWDMLGSFSLADFLPGQSADPRLYPAMFRAIPFLMCAIPAFAVWLIVQELRGAATAQLRARVGAIGLGGALANVLMVWHFASYFAPQSGSGVNVFSVLSVFGIGWIMLVLLSVGLIAVGRGWSPFSNEENNQLDASPAIYGPFDTGTIEPAQNESWGEEAFAEEERQRRSALLARVSRGAQGAAVFCILLPWATFLVSGQTVGGASGIDLIVGNVGGLNPMHGVTEAFAQGAAIAVILALFLIAGSFILSFVWGGRKRAFAATIGCGGAAVLLFIELFFLLPHSMTIQTAQSAQIVQQEVEIGTRFGFWWTLFALGIAVIANWTLLGQEDEPAD